VKILINDWSYKRFGGGLELWAIKTPKKKIQERGFWRRRNYEMKKGYRKEINKGNRRGFDRE